MLVWLTYASPAKLRLYLSPKSTERRQLRRIPAYRAQTVRPPVFLLHAEH